jgi:hypothetical protein
MKTLNVLKAMIVAGLLAGGPFSWGISRVGGGTARSAKQGFTIEAPLFFSSVRILGEESARFEGMPSIGFGSSFGFGSPQFIDLLEFRTEYSKFVSLPRAVIEAQLLGEGWTKVTTADPCLLALKKESDTAAYAIVTWGEGYGYVLVSGRSIQSKQAIDDMIKSTKLDVGACRWK